MLDVASVRLYPDAVDHALARRGLERKAERLIELDDARRALVTKIQAALERRSAISREVRDALVANEDATDASARAKGVREEIARLESELKIAALKLDWFLATIPNLPLSCVPDGADESGNREEYRWGIPGSFSFVTEHFTLGQALGMMDFAAATRMSGTRFVILKGKLASLERALAQFMLDTHVRKHGYEEVSPPLLVRDEALFGTGQLPKFADDLFYVPTIEARLIPTAEVPLTNIVRDAVLEEKKLPLRYVAGTHCFRAEAGAAGRDTRGMMRQHQFFKVELVSITTPEQALEEHERMTGCAEAVLQALGLPYRRVLLCAGDLGFSSQKTYDLEVWLPGQGRYREISSCSVCGDFQARRMNARYRPVDGKKPRFVATLNGSGVAVGRALVAVLENYQRADGSITVPVVLRPYMGVDCIRREDDE